MRQSLILTLYAITVLLICLSVISMLDIQYLIKFLIYVCHCLEQRAFTDN